MIMHVIFGLEMVDNVDGLIASFLIQSQQDTICANNCKGIPNKLLCGYHIPWSK